MGRYSHKNFPGYLIGVTTILIAVALAYLNFAQNLIFFSSLFFVAICTTDTFWKKIPNIITFTAGLIGVVYHTIDTGAAGFLTSLLGLALGLGLFIIPFALGGMGAGDVKALAALGALIGPSAVFNVFLYTALIGGVMSILHYAFNRNLLRDLAQSWQAVLVFAGTRDKSCLVPSSQSDPLRFPYAAAIALGYFTFVVRGGIL